MSGAAARAALPIAACDRARDRYPMPEQQKPEWRQPPEPHRAPTCAPLAARTDRRSTAALRETPWMKNLEVVVARHDGFTPKHICWISTTDYRNLSCMNSVSLCVRSTRHISFYDETLVLGVDRENLAVGE